MQGLDAYLLDPASVSYPSIGYLKAPSHIGNYLIRPRHYGDMWGSYRFAHIGSDRIIDNQMQKQ